MRRFRTIAALLAILSSSLAATPCGPTAPSSPGSEEAASHAGHAGHGASRDGMGHHGDPDTPPVEGGVDCGALMACGNGLRGMAVTALPAAVQSQLDGAPSVAVVEPSSADRTQDPPPPRQDT